MPGCDGDGLEDSLPRWRTSTNKQRGSFSFSVLTNTRDFGVLGYIALVLNAAGFNGLGALKKNVI